MLCTYCNNGFRTSSYGNCLSRKCGMGRLGQNDGRSSVSEGLGLNKEQQEQIRVFI